VLAEWALGVDRLFYAVTGGLAFWLVFLLLQ
jgi:hypothetical protein